MPDDSRTQLDLFADSGPVMLRNDIVVALLARDRAAAQLAVEGAKAARLTDPVLLADAERLIDV